MESSAEACPLLEVSSAYGDVVSTYNLGFAHRTGVCGVPDPLKAIDLYRKAAQQDLVVAQSELGIMLLHGEGGHVDFEHGLHWLRIAARSGDARAQGSLGSALYMSKNVNEAAEGFDWLKKASAQNDAVGTINLAQSYLHGTNVERDLDHGIDLVRPLAKQGNAAAAFTYGKGLALKIKTTGNVVEAFVWLSIGKKLFEKIGVPPEKIDPGGLHSIVENLLSSPELERAEKEVAKIIKNFPTSSSNDQLDPVRTEQMFDRIIEFNRAAKRTSQ